MWICRKILRDVHCRLTATKASSTGTHLVCLGLLALGAELGASAGTGAGGGERAASKMSVQEDA
jgi:hypothetical protein